MFNEWINIDLYQVYQLNPAICVQELQLNQESSTLTSGLQQDRKKNTAIQLKKTLRQRLDRIKDNTIRALNKEKWKEQQRLKENLGKDVVPFI